jgi:enamine deaminase RidA (YjgF/YER057c/UK114 family)
MNMEIEFSNPADIHQPLGLYSHVVALPAGAELFFISGQVGVKSDGSVGAGIEGQAEQVFANLLAVLQAHGLEAINIVKLTVFVVAGQDLGDLRNAGLKYLGSHRPAPTAVYVSRLAAPEWLVEVEAIAARPKA